MSTAQILQRAKGSNYSIQNKTSSTNIKLLEEKSKSKVFSALVAQTITSLKALHLNIKESTSIGIPSVPFKAIELQEALKEDAQSWLKAIDQESKALLKQNTFTIKRGRIPKGAITCRWVLHKKFKRNRLINYRKARLITRGFEQ
jgi:hypothetical protein